MHLVACSASLTSDFMVKVVEVSDSSQQKTLRGHEAPILSVAFDPKDDYLVGNHFFPKCLQICKNFPTTVNYDTLLDTTDNIDICLSLR